MCEKCFEWKLLRKCRPWLAPRAVETDRMFTRGILTYGDLKGLADQYNAAKQALLGESGLFSGWLRTGLQHQQFNRDGKVVSSMVDVDAESA